MNTDFEQYPNQPKEKLKFEPKVGQTYYAVDWLTLNEATAWLLTDERIWSNSSLDYILLKIGNCFTTRQEAEQNQEAVYEYLTGKKIKK